MPQIRNLLIVALALVASCSGETLRVPEEFPSIQAALEAATRGDLVLVAPGTYHERLTLEDGVTVRSEGDDTKADTFGLARAHRTVIHGEGVAGAPGVLMAEGATLDGFTVTGMGKYDDDRWKHHYETRGEEQGHEDIGHFGSPAISIDGVTCDLRHNIVHHNGHTGIAIRGREGKQVSPMVRGNISYRNMGGGIGSLGGSTATIHDNECFENFHAGIGHNQASPIVTGNRCYQNIRAGIGISEGASPVVRGNHCYDNRRAGIGIRTGKDTRPLVEDNDCHGNEMAGIGCEDEASPVIRGNRCHRNKAAGIGARHGATPLIVGNECSENAMAGIGVNNSPRAVIIGNVCQKNATAGIGASGAETEAMIMNNQCLENKLVALGIPDGATATVQGNEFTRTGGMPPLVALRGGAKVFFRDNSLTGGGVAGVLVQGKAVITNNVIRNAGNGVWVWKDSDATIQDNQIEHCRSGVTATESRVRVDDNTIKEAVQVGIKITKAHKPSRVQGNRVAMAEGGKDAIQVDGDEVTVSENTVAE